jgi:ABC-type molybdate transport system permease subunit
MSGDKQESEPFSNQHAATMRIQMSLYLMKCDKISETMKNSLVFAALSFSSTVAGTMLLIVLDTPNT